MATQFASNIEDGLFDTLIRLLVGVDNWEDAIKNPAAYGLSEWAQSPAVADIAISEFLTEAATEDGAEIIARLLSERYAVFTEGEWLAWGDTSEAFASTSGYLTQVDPSMDPIEFSAISEYSQSPQGDEKVEVSEFSDHDRSESIDEGECQEVAISPEEEALHDEVARILASHENLSVEQAELLYEAVRQGLFTLEVIGDEFTQVKIKTEATGLTFN
ncbi:hypothetical protein OG311_00080 [Streptomyces sp. NBC_01343]|uniref:hypothetical protein n=1 Tax=Streptomyces sp. NBC_01343 TaxID=2903832 RepID=UPI002E12E166|nr:hypothetical protein OG311_00080 [Streptomyces sp. NBC_01343]